MAAGFKSGILLVIGLGLLLFSGYDLVSNTDDGSGMQSGGESSVFFAAIGALLVLAGIMGLLRARKG